MKSKDTRRWTQEEDELLRAAIGKYGTDSDVDWHDVASSIENRNNKDCRKRWVYTLAPSINKGCWNQEEDALLMKGIQMHGFQWVLVSRVIGTRQPDQCSRRWHQSLNPNIKYGRWSSMEDQLLKQAVQIHGRKWTEIVDRYFPNRTPIAAKKRYTECFQVQDDKRSSSEEIPRPSEDETLDIVQSLTPAENTGSRDRRWSLTDLSCFSDQYQGRSSHNLSIEGGLENRGAAFYEYNSSLENSSITTNLHILNADDRSSNSSLTSFPQSVALTESSSTAVYQTTPPPTTTYRTDSLSLRTNRDSSSSFPFDEVLNINNNNDSGPLNLSPFPQQHPFDVLNGTQPATTFDQLFPNINYADTLAYPLPCAAVHNERKTPEQRTEPVLSSSSPKRQRGPLGVLNTHPFSPQQQGRDTSPITTPEKHHRSIKRRVIQREAHTRQRRTFSCV